MVGVEKADNDRRPALRLNQPDVVGDKRRKVARLMRDGCAEKIFWDAAGKLLQAEHPHHLIARLAAGTAARVDHFEQLPHLTRAAQTKGMLPAEVESLARLRRFQCGQRRIALAE